MNETSVELPQLSLARYFDLLKRRRWQVIPVSLLGLLVGGLIAFFVPRYYVAETRIDYYRLPVELQVRPTEDPFKLVVDNAQLHIPQAVSATMKKLGWVESAIPDPTERREKEREVEGRVSVVDVNRSEGRAYARLVVSYRDEDGVRAAEFLNTLVATWMEQQVADMRRSIETQASQANQRAKAALGEYQAINRDLAQLSAEFGFERTWDPSLQREDMRLREEALARQQQRLVDVTRELAQLRRQLTQAQQEMDRTPRDLDPTLGALEKRFSPGSQEARWFVELKVRKQSVESVMGEAHPQRASTLARIAWLEEQLRESLKGGDLADNPRIAELQRAIDTLDAAIVGAEAGKARLEAEILAGKEEQARRADAAEAYFAKARALDEAQTRREDARKSLDASLDMQQQLDSKAPIKQIAPAYVPKRPTEPNIALVAGVGCLLGLAAAIVLILALDLLRGTLKTVDDVERALHVPMLGAVSFLETPEDRRRAQASRRRASLVAGAVLVFCVALVTAYYIAPHRLPPFARDLLTLMLGG